MGMEDGEDEGLLGFGIWDTGVGIQAIATCYRSAQLHNTQMKALLQ